MILLRYTMLYCYYLMAWCHMIIITYHHNMDVRSPKPSALVLPRRWRLPGSAALETAMASARNAAKPRSLPNLPRHGDGLGRVGNSRRLMGGRGRKLGTLQFHAFWMISVIFTLFWYVRVGNWIYWHEENKRNESWWKLMKAETMISKSHSDDKLSAVVG